jgi:preprotein translocase subunit SecA
VLNKQREVIYEQRRAVLEGADISDEILTWIDETVEGIVEAHTDTQFAEEWDLEGMMVGLRAIYPVGFTLEELTREEIQREDLLDRVAADARRAYELKEQGVSKIDPELMRRAERYFLLQTIDVRWREHLDNMDYLRDGIHLRGLAQKDPLVEYRREGHAMFHEMQIEMQEEVVKNLFHFVVEVEGPQGQQQSVDPFELARKEGPLVLEHEEADALHPIGAAQDGSGRSSSSSSTGTQARQPDRDSAWSNSASWTGTRRGGSSTATAPEDRIERPAADPGSAEGNGASTADDVRSTRPGAAGRRKKRPPKKRGR